MSIVSVPYKYVSFSSVQCSCIQVAASEETLPPVQRNYPHWTELITVEELYGLPDTDYIDKQMGYPDSEDWRRIQQIRQTYYDEYYGKLDELDKDK